MGVITERYKKALPKDNAENILEVISVLQG